MIRTVIIFFAFLPLAADTGGTQALWEAFQAERYPRETVETSTQAVAAEAQSESTQTKIALSEFPAYAEDAFGYAVRLDGDTAVVGAKDDDEAKGAAYVFARTDGTWQKTATLRPDDAEVDDMFGKAVDIDGDTIVIGARGAAYVFVREAAQWTQKVKLLSEAADDGFADALALSASRMLIAAPADDTSGRDSGAVYVYVPDGATWRLHTKIPAPDAGTDQRFGNSVAIDDATAVIGADGADFGDGKAYVMTFESSDISQPSALSRPDGADVFGKSVSVDGSALLVGADEAAYLFERHGTLWQVTATFAREEDTEGFAASMALEGDTVLIGTHNGGYGRATVYRHTGGTWHREALLEPTSDNATKAYFGLSVGLSEGAAIVGTYFGNAAYVYERNGTVWNTVSTLEANTQSADADMFGFSLDIRRDTAVIGAIADDALAPNSGAAYLFVYQEGAWIQQAKLTANDGTAEARFGACVSLDDDTALIGAYGYSGQEVGSAYVFIRNGSTWTQQAKLVADDAMAGDNFGISCSLDGDTALIGAADSDDQGAAYVFVRDVLSWSQQAKLTANDGAAGDGFGVGVAVHGDTALVGAGYHDHADTDSGAAYVFIRDGQTWTQQAKLTADDGAADDGFGMAVALGEETALVGACGADTPTGSDAGSVYVFDRSGTQWTASAQLRAEDGAAHDWFGASVALDGSTALIGAIKDPSMAPGSGAAYLFDKNAGDWQQARKITAQDGDWFGLSVALDADRALIGAPGRGNGVGAAYVVDTAAATVAPDDDFDGDGNADILWRDNATDALFITFMDGTTKTGEGYVTTSGWEVPAVEDFNGDGKADILWRDGAERVFVSLMDGLARIDEGFITLSDWDVLGVADFDGDGKGDILWRDASNRIYIRLMDGKNTKDEGFVTLSSWDLLAVADFDGDGNADILWRDASTNKLFIRFMNGKTTTGEGYVTTSGWEVLAAADFDGDGKADILWRDPATDKLFIRFMNGTAKTGEGYVTLCAWDVLSVSDFSGDGKADILWRDPVTNHVYMSIMDGRTRVSEGYVTTSSWDVLSSR